MKTTAVALASIPILAGIRHAAARTNDMMRAQLKYQDTPLEGKSCTTCLEFVPGKTPTDKGSCKQIPWDDEIAPTGYCVLWNTM